MRRETDEWADGARNERNDGWKVDERPVIIRGGRYRHGSLTADVDSFFASTWKSKFHTLPRLLVGTLPPPSPTPAPSFVLPAFLCPDSQSLPWFFFGFLFKLRVKRDISCEIHMRRTSQTLRHCPESPPSVHYRRVSNVWNQLQAAGEWERHIFHNISRFFL